MKLADCPDCAIQICPHHQHALLKVLGNSHDSLPALYVELNIALTPGRAGNDEPVVSYSKPKRMPLAGNARGAQEKIIHTVQAVEQWARQELGWIPAPKRGREGPTLQAACTTLAQALDQWTRLPDWQVKAAALLALGGAARHALGVAGPRHNRIDLPCPECHTRTLRRVNGRDDIACMLCAAVLDRDWLEQQLDITPDERKAA